MDSRKLTYFLKICETGSIARAADALFISQQALSKALDSLEQELGVPLFIRSPKGLSLNRYGRVLQEEAWRMEKHQERLLRRIAAMSAEQESSVSISFYSGMLSQFPDHFFEDILDSCPDTQFHFFSYPDDAHGRQFANTDVDLFLSTTPMCGLDMTLAHEIHVPLSVLAGARHPLAGRKSVRLSDLRGETILCINSDLESQNRLQRSFALYGIRVSSVLSDAEQQFSYYLVRQRGALAFFAGPDTLLPEDTVRLPIEDSPILWSCYMYERSSGIPEAARMIERKIIGFRSEHCRQLERLFPPRPEET